MAIDIFTLGLAFILMHEMDAIRCHEWRIFPATSFMNDKTGMIVFIFLHIPLFYFPLLPDMLHSHSFRYGFSIFLIVHFFLHLLFLLHKKNEFKDWISWSLIIGAGACGLIELLQS
ncbi:MAG: DUF6713 family protein [Bacteroidota bacterium]